MTPLAKRLVGRMAELTALRSAEVALANAKDNQRHVRWTADDLAADAARLAPGDSAVVIGAGPSLHRQHPAQMLREHGYDGTIIAADGALSYCLRNGLVPHFLVTLDPDPSRMCRWFGDTELESRPDDDYFRRQDLDPYLGTDERARNRELIELVNRHGSSMRAIICTSVAPNVTRRCLESGMTLYWWNPLLDDVERPESLARRLYQMNRIPCMVSGGNVGAAAWVAAHQLLGKRQIALVGMDFGYAPGTPIERTQYFSTLAELFGDRAHDALIRVKNPHLKDAWLTDPAYYWYRDAFLDMAAQAPAVTYNCTEGGILFGRGVQWVPLKAFLAARSPAAEAVG